MNYVWILILATLALAGCSADPEALSRKQAQDIITDWLNADGFFDREVRSVYLCEPARARGIEQGLWSDVKYARQAGERLPELGRQYFMAVEFDRYQGRDVSRAFLNVPVKRQFKEIASFEI